MSTITPPQDPETNPRIKAVFDDIRATRKSNFINNLWYYLAFDTELLETTWRDVKEVMTKPSHLDPLTKELIYVAVSVTNGCEYCVKSHSLAAKKKGATNDMINEMIAVVGMANETNRLVEGYQVELDEKFK